MTGRRSIVERRPPLAVLLALALAVLVPLAPARAADDEAAAGVANAFTTAEIADGFLKTVFGGEGPTGHDAESRLVHKFTRPVRVSVESRSRFVDRRAEVRAFVRRLDRLVPNLTITNVTRASRSNMQVYLVDRGNYRAVIREVAPAGTDTRFIETNECSALTGGDKPGVLDHAVVFVVVNEGASRFRACMVEEITQSLGPVNDDPSLPFSIYNDESGVDGFGLFDWFILTTLYDRRIKPAMTKAEVTPLLPAAIGDARKAVRRLVLSGAIRPE